MKLSHTLAALMISLVVAGTADAAPKKKCAKPKKDKHPVCEAVENRHAKHRRHLKKRRAEAKRRAAAIRRAEEARRQAEIERCRRIEAARRAEARRRAQAERRRRAAEACRPKPVHVITVRRCERKPVVTVTRCKTTTRHTPVARVLHERHEVHHRHMRTGLKALHYAIFGR